MRTGEKRERETQRERLVTLDCCNTKKHKRRPTPIPQDIATIPSVLFPFGRRSQQKRRDQQQQPMRTQSDSRDRDTRRPLVHFLPLSQRHPPHIPRTLQFFSKILLNR
jgi:hypothetical protein